MLRLVFSTLRYSIKPVLNLSYNGISNCTTPITSIVRKSYSTTLLQNVLQQHQRSLLSNPNLIQISNEINGRTVTKFSMRKGKRKAVKTVLKRFYRLHWGGWIRTIAGRHRRIWAKRPKRRVRVKQHVLCNATQSRLLDKMVTNFWRRPKYYVDDPYEPYHTREECIYTYKKPRPYFPPE